MNGMRVCYENLTDASYKLTALSTNGVLAPANMLNNLKDEVWRCIGQTSQISIAWRTQQLINMVALVFTNMTSTAQVRVQGFVNENDVVPILDTGLVNALAYAPLGSLNWGSSPLGVNAFRFGGVSHGRVYFDTVNVAKLTIDVQDFDNVNNYIEVARLVTGMYWSPECNPEYGAELQYHYFTQHEESQSGDLRTERRPRRRGLNLNLSWIRTQDDQYAMHEILLGAGMDTPVFISLFPEDADPLLEQRWQMYAKLDGDHSMSAPSFGTFASPLRLLEI